MPLLIKAAGLSTQRGRGSRCWDCRSSCEAWEGHSKVSEDSSSASIAVSAPPPPFFIIVPLVATLFSSTVYLGPGKGNSVPRSVHAFFPETLIRSIAPLYKSCLSCILRWSWLQQKCFYSKKKRKKREEQKAHDPLERLVLHL